MCFLTKERETQHFLSMLHHEESPEKPQYGNLPFLNNPPPPFCLTHLFLAKIFRLLPSPHFHQFWKSRPSPLWRAGSNYVGTQPSTQSRQKELFLTSAVKNFSKADIKVFEVGNSQVTKSSYAKWRHTSSYFFHRNSFFKLLPLTQHYKMLN